MKTKLIVLAMSSLAILTLSGSTNYRIKNL